MTPARMHSVRATLISGLLLALCTSMAHAQDTAAEPAATPAAAPTPEPAPFSVQTEGRLQARYTLESRVTLDDAMQELRDESSHFTIPRARFGISGHAFSKSIKYKFQADFGRGNVSLKDFYLDYGLGDVVVRVGQYKRPFSRQQITSSGRLELVDRAITDRSFDTGRDIGVMLHNTFEKSPNVEWALGVLNGQIADKLTDGRNYPAFFGPAIVARVGMNSGGIAGYSEADLEGGPLRLGAAASILANFGARADGGGTIAAQADAIVKVHGLSATAALYLLTTEAADGFFDQSTTALGVHAQLGYMLARQHQAAARYAMISDSAADTRSQEITVGYSFYQVKHNLKWQTDISLLAPDGAALGDVIMARSQLQLAF